MEAIDYMELMNSTTITISERTRRELLKVAGELQQKLGKKVDYEDVIEYLLQRQGKSEALLRSKEDDIAGEMKKKPFEIQPVFLS
jgi:hypothetical protein